MVTIGLERPAEYVAALRGRRIGLFASYTSVDRKGRPSLEVLLEHHLDIRTVFTGEHGVWGDAPPGEKIEDTVDPFHGIPVRSLYKKETGEVILDASELDAIVVDIQDLGARYATRIALMGRLLQAAAEAGIPCWVFDRPNPCGTAVRGNILDPRFRSLVGPYAYPIQHGMSVGEVACYIARTEGLGQPHVIKMAGWLPNMLFGETGHLWIGSPNLPSLQAVYLYPGTCLIEGTNISEGRGTTRPFQVFGAPWVDPIKAARLLQRLDLPGVAWSPSRFRPTSGKHAGADCYGVQVHVTDPKAVDAIEVGLSLLAAFWEVAGDRCEWLTGGRGFRIDYLAGTDELRRYWAGLKGVPGFLSAWRQQSARFAEAQRPHSLYPRNGEPGNAM